MSWPFSTRKERKQKIRSRLREIVDCNSHLHFSLFNSLFQMTELEKEIVSEILGWGKINDLEWIDVIRLFPKQITPPEHLWGREVRLDIEYDREKGKEIKSPTYYLTFDERLVPIYVKWGWEGAEDWLPYSPYGYASEELEEVKEWDPGARLKKPQEPEMGIIHTLRWLVQEGIIKLPD